MRAVAQGAETVAVIALDVGSRRVGLAGADPTGTLASPLGMLERTHPRFWERLAAFAAERGCDTAVVGLPRMLDGSEGSAAADARAFAAEVERRLGLRVELWDERLTTVAAERGLIAEGVRRADRRRVIDARAAALMLQGWLDSRRRKGGA